ncbi:MAG: hypothetical protein LBO76_05325, partial [Treponema sp.]|nr:hypothetical protein [Treponema sp.]
YDKIVEITNKKTDFLIITLCPEMKVCQTNRGTRELNDWERNRIVELYKNGVASYHRTDKFINNTYQTIEETVKEVLEFIKKKHKE